MMNSSSRSAKPGGGAITKEVSMGVAMVDVRGAVEATTGGAAKMTTEREVSMKMITVDVGKVRLVAVIREQG